MQFQRSSRMAKLFLSLVCMLGLDATLSAEAIPSMVEVVKLTASDATQGDSFGYSVSISRDYAVIGAFLDDDSGVNSGSAYIFKRNGSGWLQQAKLTASDTASFGSSVSISGDYVIVGASGNDNGAGSAYIFEKPTGGWVNATEMAKLTASDSHSYALFGRSVSISGDCVIVGAEGNNENGSHSGSAYIFEKPVSGWVNMTETAKLTASDGDNDNLFGASVSIKLFCSWHSATYTLVVFPNMGTQGKGCLGIWLFWAGGFSGRDNTVKSNRRLSGPSSPTVSLYVGAVAWLGTRTCLLGSRIVFNE